MKQALTETKAKAMADTVVPESTEAAGKPKYPDVVHLGMGEKEALSLSSSRVSLAAERALGLMNEVRKECEEAVFDEWSLKAAYRKVAEGEEYTLSMMVGRYPKDTSLYTVGIIRDLEEHPDEAGLDARYRLLHVSPPLCPVEEEEKK